MTVSVALATYNGEHFLKPQLDSVLCSTRKPDEVVIIDDCSCDGTADLVKKYIAEHNLAWQFSVADKNSGYKRNFYNCLKQCTGDIIFLCDQDDEWYSEKIEKITAVFEADPEVLAVNSSFDMTDQNGEIIFPFTVGKKTSNHHIIKFPLKKGEIKAIDLATVLVYNISPGCTCAFRREVVDEYIKTSECIMPHDWELNIIAAKKGGLRYYNLPFIGYRQHGGNTIGITEEESFGPLQMRGTVDVRFNVLSMQKAQADLIERHFDGNSKAQVRFARALRHFCDNREKILFKKRLWPCFKNFLIYPRLKNVATVHFRGLIGDIVYVLKGKFH